MEVVDEVIKVIAKVLKNVPIEHLKPETKLADIGAESLDVIEIVFELEEKFGITIPFQANEAAKAPGSSPTGAQNLPFTTIEDVAKAVKQLVDAKASS